MAAVKKLDPTVMYMEKTCMEKTEKWRKLRVLGVALDRYARGWTRCREGRDRADDI